MFDLRPRGLDTSHWQNVRAMRYAAWRIEPGLLFMWGRASIGLDTDEIGLEHAASARAVGYLAGLYHALHEGWDARRQARLFFTLVSDFYAKPAPAGGYVPPAIDIERLGLREQNVTDFLDEWNRLGGSPLIIYTSAQVWHSIVGRGLKLWASRLLLWIAAYPFDPDGPIALRSTPPLDRQPPIPDAWRLTGKSWAFWQHTGAGRLAGYAGNLDLNVFAGSLAELLALAGVGPIVEVETRMIQPLGPHHLSGGADTARWLTEARPRVAKAVGDLGVLALAPTGTLRIGRMDDLGSLEGQGFDINRYFRDGRAPGEIADLYTAWLEPYIRANPWVDVWEGPNEQVFEHDDREALDPALAASMQSWRIAVMRWYAEFLYEYARRIRDLGAQLGRPLRAGLGGWAVGTPRLEWDLWPAYVRALEAVRAFGAILTRHEYGPLDGFNSLRYRKDNARFTELGFPDPPIIISEAGADDAGGMSRWRTYYNGDIGRYWRELLQPYSLELLADPYCLGAVVFCIGDDAEGTWRGFDVDATGLVDLVIEQTRIFEADPYLWRESNLMATVRYLLTVDSSISTGQIKDRLGEINIVELGLYVPIVPIGAPPPPPPTWYEALPNGPLSPWLASGPISETPVIMYTRTGQSLGIPRSNNFDLREKVTASVTVNGQALALVLFRVIDSPINGQIWYARGQDLRRPSNLPA